MKVRASVKRRCEFCQIIKRHGKNPVIEQHKQYQHHSTEDHAENHVITTHGIDTAEHIVIDIDIHTGSHGGHHHAYCKSTC